MGGFLVAACGRSRAGNAVLLSDWAAGVSPGAAETVAGNGMVQVPPQFGICLNSRAAQVASVCRHRRKQTHGANLLKRAKLKQARAVKVLLHLDIH